MRVPWRRPRLLRSPKDVEVEALEAALAERLDVARDVMRRVCEKIERPPAAPPEDSGA